MRLSNFLRALGLALCVMAMAAATPTRAEWRRAESAHFIVYSQGSERSLRRHVGDLETYDFLLRTLMGLSVDEAIPRKLPIYLVGNRNGLVRIHPGTPAHAAGTYFPTGEDIFAAAIADTGQDYLFHEYFHHFSFQLGSTATYPAWLVEGLAEYFMTAEIKPGSVEVGGFNEDRVYWLFNASWIPLDDLLTKRVREVRAGFYRETYYPVAWLLTHWFMSDDTRRRQLADYTADVAANGDSVAAMERATGMSLVELRRTLGRYRRLNVTTYTFDRPEPEITVTVLPRSADDLLLIGQRLNVGVEDEQRDETARLVRQLAARHPDDPFALLQLGHAELHFGDPEAGEAVLNRLLEREPDNVEALQLMATHYATLAEERPDESLALLRQARRHLARAYRADEGNYYTLHLLARTREGASDYPNDNDLLTWSKAYEFAPQLSSIRLGYASAMMQAGEFANAVALLEPLANSPHGGPASEAAQSLVVLAQAGRPPLAADELEAAAEASALPTEPEPEPGAPAPDPESEPAAEPQPAG